MPTYEYRCDHCGHEFSRKQGFNEEPVTVCPKCGARPRKLVSRPAIHFKGSGWHINDYRKASDGGSTSGEGSEAAAKDAPPKSSTTKKEATESKDTKDKKPGGPKTESSTPKPDSSDSAAS
ncbi:MAG: zinc ribbon domain-containing protein [Chloroflexi bacterium]|nr:MAG: zinc ribbon domain-containing protein [Chloroflexota bacterium]